MKILFTLCGRAGSKGVKGKNARDFLDIPLVWYSMANIVLYKDLRKSILLQQILKTLYILIHYRTILPQIFLYIYLL